MYKLSSPFIISWLFLLSASGGWAALNAVHTFFQSNMILLLEVKLLSTVNSNISLSFTVDLEACLFCVTVLTIFASVLSFSYWYMSSEKFFTRFHFLVLLFVVSMLTLIFSSNIIGLLLGWDGLGVSSYLLVIFFNSKKANQAGLITILSNRVGDCLILIAGASLMAMSVTNFWSLSFSGLYFTGLGALLVLASFTKSAQIPFSAWLPAAMAAPTPVSSLVHSSTLVTAGIYLMFRSWDMLPYSVKIYILVTGTITLFMASFAGVVENDMKKIVALSTLSQLSFMAIALSLNEPGYSFFHLLSHAYFKALLFISVGSMIHLSSDYQDLRIINLSSNLFLFSSSFAVVASWNLMGLPFMMGFFSKDLILENFEMLCLPYVVLGLIISSVSLTAIYSCRLLLAVFCSKKTLSSSHCDHENSTSLILGLSILAVCAVVCGPSLSRILLHSIDLVVLPLEMKNLILFISLTSITSVTVMRSSMIFVPYKSLSVMDMWFISSLSFYSLKKSCFSTSFNSLLEIDSSFNWWGFLQMTPQKKLVFFELFSKTKFNFQLALLLLLVVVFIFPGDWKSDSL